MTKTSLGTTRGDVPVFAGRTPLGFIRGTGRNLYAYKADGTPIGCFGDRAAAERAILSRASQGGGA